MYRIYIADDEPKIRQRLSNLIPWNELDCNIVGTGKDGKETLQFIQTNSVDICLVDICMPQLSGLQLIQALRKENSQLLFIVVSGYDEFDYAQKSIALNVFDYLLKPVSAKKLKGVIEKAIQSIEDRKNKENEWTTALRLASKKVESLRDNFLEKLTHGLFTQEDLEEESALLSFPFNGRYLFLVMLQDENNANYSLREHKLRFLHLQREWREIVGETLVVTLDIYDNAIAFCETPKNIENIHAQLKQNFPTIYCYEDCTLLQIPRIYEQWLDKNHSQTAPLVVDALALIDQNYDDINFDMGALSSKLHVSSGYLGRMLKQQTGMTFHEYLSKTRIRIAVGLLSDTHLKIFEIADKVGYSTQHYFCTAFKRIMGVSPSEYRNKGGKIHGTY